ncbi:MAG TPA: hypothetical protein VFI47_06075 [Acidimicrobiales bacterium]|nr:hypothetical protein [Acidimicrobiales bacterium]
MRSGSWAASPATSASTPATPRSSLPPHAASSPPSPDSAFARAGSAPQRNAQVTSVAPTGTVSLIAGTTAGIEPMFAIAYARNVLGRHLVEVNPHFERLARDRGFYSDELMAAIARTGGVRDNPNVPDDVRAAFPTALEIAPQWHLRIQAAVQRHVDAAVSKTINLPAEATVDDVRAIYLAAWRVRVKGITVCRYGSRPRQVLTLLSADAGAALPSRRCGSTPPLLAAVPLTCASSEPPRPQSGAGPVPCVVACGSGGGDALVASWCRFRSS